MPPLLLITTPLLSPVSPILTLLRSLSLVSLPLLISSSLAAPCPGSRPRSGFGRSCPSPRIDPGSGSRFWTVRCESLARGEARLRPVLWARPKLPTQPSRPRGQWSLNNEGCDGRTVPSPSQVGRTLGPSALTESSVGLPGGEPGPSVPRVGTRTPPVLSKYVFRDPGLGTLAHIPEPPKGVFREVVGRRFWGLLQVCTASSPVSTLRTVAEVLSLFFRRRRRERWRGRRREERGWKETLVFWHLALCL